MPKTGGATPVTIPTTATEPLKSVVMTGGAGPVLRRIAAAGRGDIAHADIRWQERSNYLLYCMTRSRVAAASAAAS